MSRDAKNSLFTVSFVCFLFGALFLGSQLDAQWKQIVIPITIAIMFGLGKRYVLDSKEADGKDG